MENNVDTTEGAVTKEKLAQDLKALVRDAEELVKASADTLAEKSREELKAALERLKASSRRVEAKAVEGAEATEELIREHPYQSIGIAFGVGLLIGVLVNR